MLFANERLKNIIMVVLPGVFTSYLPEQGSYAPPESFRGRWYCTFPTPPTLLGAGQPTVLGTGHPTVLGAGVGRDGSPELSGYYAVAAPDRVGAGRYIHEA
jgi:hypothetical protein